MEQFVMAEFAEPEGLVSEIAADPNVMVYNILQEEIASVLKAVETYHKETLPNAHNLVPYAEDAEHLLSASLGHLKLKVCYSNVNDQDVSLERSIDLTKQQDSCRVALLTRLSLYLLQTRGRLTRKKKEKKILNTENNINLYHSEGFEMTPEKQEFLENCKDLHQAKSLRRIFCMDPGFSARVLQVMSPRLEEADVEGPGPTHLSILGSMPRLKRLNLDFPSKEFKWNDHSPFQWEDEQKTCGSPCENNLLDTTKPWIFNEGPPVDGGLVSLKVSLPRHVLFPFIALHRHTLRELTIVAGLPAESGDEMWAPKYFWFCNDMPERLADLVGRFPMESLRLLELHRHHGYSEHCIAKCKKQLQDIRRVLGPAVVVRCNRCG